jgi:hypothetical protein
VILQRWEIVNQAAFDSKESGKAMLLGQLPEVVKASETLKAGILG